MQRSHTLMIKFKSTLSLAIQAAMLGALTVGTSTLVWAETSVNQHTLSTQVNIAAGSLDQVLAQFAGLSGVQISYDPALVAGKKSAGLKGQYAFEQGIAELLNGTGLKLAKRADGAWTIEQHQNQARDMGQLKPIDVKVQGSANRDANAVQLPVINVTAENENSYTVKNTSTATKLNLSLRETPQSVSVITRQQMDDQAAISIGDALRNTPGVSVQAFDSNRMLYFTRGFDITNYQYDGVNTIVDNIYEGSPHGDAATYERIEVIKGATGLMTGSGDPSATVNIIRKKPTHDFSASVAGSAGSWDNYRTEADISGPLNDAGTVRGRFVGAYQDRKSYLDHYKQNNDTLYGIIEADVMSDTLLTFGIDRYGTTPRGVSWTGNPVYFTDGTRTNFSRSHNPGADWSRRDFESTTYFAALEQTLAHDWKLKVSLDYLVTDHDTRLASASGGNPDPVTGEGMFMYWGRWEGHRVQNTADINISGPFSLFGREHELVAGVMVSHSRLTGDTFDGSAFSMVSGSIFDWNGKLPEQDFPINGNYKTTQSQNGIYLATRLRPSDNLALILGTRVSNFKFNNDEDYFDTSSLGDVHTSYKEHGVVTPYAGIVYDLDDTYSVYASYTSIYQPQTNKDINGSTLAPVEGNGYEAGLKAAYLDGKLNAALALFRIEQDNVAENVGTNPVTNEGIYRAIEGATTKGVELELAGELKKDWSISAGYTYARNRDADQQRIYGYPLATTQPEHVVRLFTSYRLSGDLSRVTIGGGIKWQSVFYGNIYNPTIDDYTLIEQRNYMLVDLMTRYQQNEHLSFTLNANNVLDKKYLTGLGNFDTTYYGEPRSIILTAKYQF
ncbi:TonB-dependent siderophore receptor [Acinetobacter puyangensis]|uniref:Outer-membrane receptor for ferric coprogen and ferric-rhodotorulic acid n=1 Tax=Acinetobacter puyangensis TaxID=1096779 RepID=A0A240E424_9GAMM|nr:TonB-dependent receptor [Acinetobacter puyangensis]SNX43524.1 outer-membrane receptor for ferric coprogen and ferric-rhodotorulic acid [Acinetobacter puyangensis]